MITASIGESKAALNASSRNMKILAARRNRITEIIIPERNKVDLDKLDAEVKGDVVFHTVSDISEVISIAFPEESTKRLEKSILDAMMQEKKRKEEEERARSQQRQSEIYEKVMQWQ